AVIFFFTAEDGETRSIASQIKLLRVLSALRGKGRGVAAYSAPPRGILITAAPKFFYREGRRDAEYPSKSNSSAFSAPLAVKRGVAAHYSLPPRCEPRRRRPQIPAVAGSPPFSNFQIFKFPH